MGGPEIEQLISLFARLPGFGPRSARRVVLRLLQQPETRLVPLMRALEAANSAVRLCGRCGNLDSVSPCTLCRDPDRDTGLICVVETVADLWALERAGVNPGRYHVLGGVLSALSGVTPEALNLTTLFTRVTEGEAREVVLALPATVDGATTAHYLTEQLRGHDIRLTQLSQGVPIGGSLETLDDGTLAAALRARHAV